MAAVDDHSGFGHVAARVEYQWSLAETESATEPAVPIPLPSHKILRLTEPPVRFFPSNNRKALLRPRFMVTHDAAPEMTSMSQDLNFKSIYQWWQTAEPGNSIQRLDCIVGSS